MLLFVDSLIPYFLVLLLLINIYVSQGALGPAVFTRVLETSANGESPSANYDRAFRHDSSANGIPSRHGIWLVGDGRELSLRSPPNLDSTLKILDGTRAAIVNNTSDSRFSFVKHNINISPSESSGESENAKSKTINERSEGNKRERTKGRNSFGGGPSRAKRKKSREGARGAAADFSSHRIVVPRIHCSRTKRELHNTLERSGGHSHHITLGLNLGEEDVLIHLQLNRDLLAKDYFEKRFFENESHIVTRHTPQSVSMCYYKGFIPSKPGSWAALSTCNGIRGVVFDGVELHYVEPTSKSAHVRSPHYIMRHQDVKTKNLTCGYIREPQRVSDFFHDETFTRLLRYKRDASQGPIHGPFNSNALSRYVELILVADKTEFEKHDSDVEAIYQRFKDIANIVNALYQPLNIFIALIGAEVWEESDPVEISTDGDKTLTNFLNYRKVRLIPEHPNDNAQLLTGKVFESGVVGKALKGPICTYQYSGGVNMDHSESVGLVATTVAHEMGHNFGMEHDNEEDCKCPDKRCIMAPSSGTRSPQHWSSCSHEYLAISFERSMDYCLRNRPETLFASPVCGNGFVEPGEQCDCGLADHCNNPCCNATSCMLLPNATCATGHCCDLETCRPKFAGFECRSALHVCDLPEFCSGDSEYCPDNFYKEDGAECMGGKAFCYQGMCRTHEHQCRLLWGPTGKNSHDKCYNLNREGNTNGNCGYNWPNNTYKKCSHDNIQCGMLHCKHFNERLEFGMESVSKVSHRFISDKTQGVIPCRVAQVDLGLDMVDPGLAPDGAKCGYGRMCVDQKCLPVASLRLHKCDCNGNGVCNNKGNCHCDLGFSWPDCIYPGLGGSEDSGPASYPGRNYFLVGMYIFFLGIAPLSAAVFCIMYYGRGRQKFWWLRKDVSKGESRSTTDQSKSAGGRKTAHSVEVASKGAAPEADGTALRSPTPPSSQGSKSNSPLLNNSSQAGVFDKEFMGRYEGFTISPIKTVKNGTTLSNVAVDSPTPASNYANLPTVSITNERNCFASPTSPILGSVSFRARASPFRTSNTRPKVDISSPSLQTSTNPDVETYPSEQNKLPHVPPFRPTSPPVAVVTPSRRAPLRPKSVPDATSLAVHANTINLVHSNSMGQGASNPKHNKLSTVSRIASFLKKSDKTHSEGSQTSTRLEMNERMERPQPLPDISSKDSFDSTERSNTLPRKASKINRESLLQLEISNPIQLTATELPTNLVPVRPAPGIPKNIHIPTEVTNPANLVSTDAGIGRITWSPPIPHQVSTDIVNNQNDLQRIGSVRETTGTPRMPTPRFGSMRAQRPKSLPPARPCQPPPRPPLPMIPGTPEGEGEYLYDDIAGLPVSGIDQTPEGIYATIDENSPDRESSPENSKKAKKSLFSLLYSKKKGPASAPAPLYSNVETSSSSDSRLNAKQDASHTYDTPSSVPINRNSAEEGGLLSEIVTELASREPQYMNTLSKKDKRGLKSTFLKKGNSSNSLNESKEGLVNKGSSIVAPSPSTSVSIDAQKNSTFQWHKPSHKDYVSSNREPIKQSSFSISKPEPIVVAKPVLYSDAKPRGVFSFLKGSSNSRSGSEENDKLSGSTVTNNTAFESFDESPVNLESKPLTALQSVKNAKSELLEAVNRAKKESEKSEKLSPPIKVSQTNTVDVNIDSVIKNKEGTTIISPKPDLVQNFFEERRPYFPPDLVLNKIEPEAKPVEKKSTKPLVNPSTKPKIASSKLKKPATAPGATKVNKILSSTSNSSKSVVPGSTAIKDGKKVPVKKPPIAAKVDCSAPKGFTRQRSNPKMNASDSKKGSKESLKDESKKETQAGIAKSSVRRSGRLGSAGSIGKGKVVAPPTISSSKVAGATSKITSPTSTKTNVMAAAAKGGSLGISNVASLQQKFEKETENQSDKKSTNNSQKSTAKKVDLKRSPNAK